MLKFLVKKNPSLNMENKVIKSENKFYYEGYNFKGLKEIDNLIEIKEERFKDQLKLQEKGDEEAMFIDNDFIRSLEYGMPPTSGMGIGMEI